MKLEYYKKSSKKYLPNIKIMSKKRNNFWNIWKWNWNTTLFDSYEKLNKRRKEIKKELNYIVNSSWVIGKTWISSETIVKRKWWIYSIFTQNIEDYKYSFWGIRDRINIFKKIVSSDYVKKNDSFIENIVNNRFDIFSRCFDSGADFKKWVNKVKSDFKSKSIITDDDIKGYIKDLWFSEDGNNPLWKFCREISRWKYAETTIPIENLNFSVEKDNVFKVANLTKWKRINNSFVQWIDYKPLKYKEKPDNKNKKKLLFIIDISWSMCWKPYKNALWFTKSTIDTWIFDVTVYTTNCLKVDNITDNFNFNWNTWLFECPNSWDWFEYLNDRMLDEKTDKDYIVVLTDMRVWEFAEREIKEYLSSKKHLILSFADEPTFPELNCRLVKDIKDMKRVISTLFS